MHHPAKIAALARPRILVPVHHHGVALPARFVSETNDDDFYVYTFPFVFSSHLCFTLSKWWYLYGSKHLHLYNVLGWCDVYNSYVKHSVCHEINTERLNPFNILAVCVSTCLNGATCNSGNLCACTSSWSGSTCTVRK